ncbi:nitrite reductase [Cytobacillus sp. FJAT-54145]|uniref:Nitrite reductase n=1 Tax=Cytobacillus spartinae TaxID=3299023 RepID=A0ABW6K893_9BACI
MENNIKVAVHPGIGFGSKLNTKQLNVLLHYLPEDSEVELTVFQQLYIEINEEKYEQMKSDFNDAGLECYPVGFYVKSLRTCNFCKGAEEEGMPVAIQLNKRIAGQPVPFPLRPAYTGCPNACGEPLINDIGVIKKQDGYDLYIGGKAKGIDAKIGRVFKSGLTPEELYETVDQLIDLYRSNGKKREHFSRFIDRFGWDNLQARE